jgi:hypothetical protein
MARFRAKSGNLPILAGPRGRYLDPDQDAQALAWISSIL